MYTSKIYKTSPVFVQNILASVYGLIRLLFRESKLSTNLKQELKAHERDIEALKYYSKKQLLTSLNNAIENTEFYSGLQPNISCFSYIDKNTVIANPEKFINNSYRGLIIKGNTSGTTGTPLKILQSKESVEKERAFANRQREWAGYKKGDKRAWIRGEMIVPIDQVKPPYWRYSYFENMIMLSSYHLSLDAMPTYIDAMVKFGVDIIQANTSSIVNLARYLESKDDYYPGKLKSIITSSETLFPEDRQVIEERFNSKVFDWYGLFERVAAIGTCEFGRYHVLTDYSYIEFLDSGNGLHEIVGTNFNNLYYPLIRYRTGDFVVLSEEASCPCGRIYPLIKSIEGRIGDYIVGENGRKIHILSSIPKDVKGIIMCQFLQNKLNHIEILVVPDKEKFDNSQILKLIKNTKFWVGESMNVEVKCVDLLQRGQNGKIRQAICNIKEVK